MKRPLTTVALLYAGGLLLGSDLFRTLFLEALGGLGVHVQPVGAGSRIAAQQRGTDGGKQSGRR